MSEVARWLRDQWTDEIQVREFSELDLEELGLGEKLQSPIIEIIPMQINFLEPDSDELLNPEVPKHSLYKPTVNGRAVLDKPYGGSVHTARVGAEQGPITKFQETPTDRKIIHPSATSNHSPESKPTPGLSSALHTISRSPTNRDIYPAAPKPDSTDSAPTQQPHVLTTIAASPTLEEQEPPTSVDRPEALVPAWKQLISHPLAISERVSLITTIFSDRDGVHEVNHLCGNDAQSFVDVIDEVGTFPLLTPRGWTQWLNVKLPNTLDRYWIRWRPSYRGIV